MLNSYLRGPLKMQHRILIQVHQVDLEDLEGREGLVIHVDLRHQQGLLALDCQLIQLARDCHLFQDYPSDQILHLYQVVQEIQ